MDIRKLQRVIVDALDDVKAHDIRVFNTSEQTGLFDRVILATGTSNRQTRALASHVREKTKAAGGHVISTEGEETGEWVLVDLGDAVVHIMQPAIRVYYNLEELWGSKPVQIKRSAPAGSSRTPRRATTDAIGPAPAEAEGEKAQKAPARRRQKEPEGTNAVTGKPKAPPRARKEALPEGAAETSSRKAAKAPRRRVVKASAEGLAVEPREAAAPAPDDRQPETATPKRRAARKAGLG